MTPGAVALKPNGHEGIKTNPWPFTIASIFYGLATIVFTHFQTFTTLFSQDIQWILHAKIILCSSLK